ncbi:ribonuclease VapC6 [Streptomyces sp. NE5-10]|uniref:PIN domain-containing protein n=1 Tax=Streptomyces sp. NE5-10 TaxID=2759674 RepID=UPI001906C123|nr:PIN domain-containing protein [Streptomyces sp. NE5-10]GHJ90693.1 ribonuclease VapC6 [Streptomyces sp. NE5-10]
MITYLVDTSAYVHLGADHLAQRRREAEIDTGAIGMCEATRAEVLFMATGPDERDDTDEELAAPFGPVRVPKDAWRWVDAARHKLPLKGRHRAAGVVDLLLCATAVHHGLTAPHRDHDFAAVARVLKEVEQQDVRGS